MTTIVLTALPCCVWYLKNKNFKSDRAIGCLRPLFARVCAGCCLNSWCLWVLLGSCA